MSTIHPVFAGILAMHGMPETLTPEQADQARRVAYVAALRRMDWTFESSDDHKVWQRARDELKRLRLERAAIDPDGAIWVKHCHPDFVNWR